MISEALMQLIESARRKRQSKRPVVHEDQLEISQEPTLPPPKPIDSLRSVLPAREQIIVRRVVLPYDPRLEYARPVWATEDEALDEWRSRTLPDRRL